MGHAIGYNQIGPSKGKIRVVISSRVFVAVVFGVAIVLSATVGLHSEWAECGNPVIIAEGRQSSPAACPDGSGGTIISWNTVDEGGYFDVYAQRLDSQGNIQWLENGIPVRVAEGCQRNRGIVPDGSGGAIVVWLAGCVGDDEDIWASHIDANGSVVGAADGYPICTAPYRQTWIVALPDNEGGAYIVWEDWRSGSRQVYAQRIDSECNTLWQDDGIPVCALPTGQAYPCSALGNDGGIIVAWQDYRNHELYIENWDIFAQRINGQGSLMWNSAGVPICTLPSKQAYPSIASDGDGGAYICWQDDRAHLGYNDIYVQRIDSMGVAIWEANGLPACSADGTRWHPQIVSAFEHDAVVVWYDSNGDVYAQAVHPDGSMEYGASGFGVCTAPGDQRTPSVCNNGCGDIIIAWADYRVLPGRGYIQLLDHEGVFALEQNGIPVCPGEQPLSRPTMCADGFGGIVGVSINESQNEGDLFAKKLLLPQAITDTRIALAPAILKQNYPNPFNPSTTIEYYLPQKREVTLEILDINGRLIRRYHRGSEDAGTHRIVWSGLNAHGDQTASGIYLYRLIAGQTVIARKMVLLK